MTNTSDEDDDEVPISQMVARRKSKRNKPKRKSVPAKKAPKRPPASRRSRRLRQSNSDDEQEQEETVVVQEVKPVPKKKAPAKKKAAKKVKANTTTKTVVKNDDSSAFSPRKTRSMRRVAKTETVQDKQQDDDDEEEESVEEEPKPEESVKDKPKDKEEPDTNAAKENNDVDEDEDSPKAKQEKEEDRQEEPESMDTDASDQEKVSSPPKKKVDSETNVVQQPKDDSGDNIMQDNTLSSQDATMTVVNEHKGVQEQEPSRHVPNNKEVDAKKQEADVDEKDLSNQQVDKETDAIMEQKESKGQDVASDDDKTDAEKPFDDTKPDSPPLGSPVDTDAKQTSLEAMDIDQATSQQVEEKHDQEPVVSTEPDVHDEKLPVEQQDTPAEAQELQSMKISPPEHVEDKGESRTEQATAVDEDHEMPASKGPLAPHEGAEATEAVVGESLPGVADNASAKAVVSESKGAQDAGSPETKVSAQDGDVTTGANAGVSSPLDLLARVADNSGIAAEAKDVKVAAPEESQVSQPNDESTISHEPSPLDLLANVADGADTPAAEELKDSVKRQVPPKGDESTKDSSKDSPTTEKCADKDDNACMVDEPKDSSLAPMENQVSGAAKDGTEESPAAGLAEGVAANNADLVVEGSKTAEESEHVAPPEKQATKHVKMSEGAEPMQVDHVEAHVERTTNESEIVQAKSPLPPLAPSVSTHIREKVGNLPSESQQQQQQHLAEVKKPPESSDTGATAVTKPEDAPTAGTTNVSELGRVSQPRQHPATTGEAPADSRKNDQVIHSTDHPAISAEPEVTVVTESPMVAASETVDAVLESTTVVTRPPGSGMLGGPQEGVTARDAMEVKGEASGKTVESTGGMATADRTPATDTVGVTATIVSVEHGIAPELPTERVPVKKLVHQVDSSVPPKPAASTDATKGAAEANSEAEAISAIGKATLPEGDKHVDPVSPKEKEMEGSSIEKKREAQEQSQTLGSGDNSMEVDEPLAETANKPATKADSSVGQQDQEHVENELTKEVSRDGSDKSQDTKATIKISPTVPVTFKPPTPEETAALLDAFPNMTKRKKASDARPKKRRRKHLSIKISSVPSSAESERLPQPAESVAVSNPPQALVDTIMPNAALFSNVFVSELENEGISSRYERELEDSLAFFSDTHEEEDTMFIKLQQEKEKGRLKEELENIKAEYNAGVVKINAIIASQMKEKQTSADINIEKLRKKQSLEEQKDLHRLQEAYSQKMKSSNSKIDYNIKVMTNRHSQEMQRAHAQHRQQAQQRGVAEQVATAEWGPIAQGLQVKQQQEVQTFSAKGEELKKKLDAEYSREKEKYIAHHQNRKKELDHTMQKLISRMRATFQQQHQRYLKAHASKLKRRREEILSLLAESKQEQRTAPAVAKGDKGSSERKPELRSPPPVALRTTVVGEVESGAPGAASRSKHRKSILSAARKQLSVEIHNEGLWVSVLSEKDDSKKDGSDSKSRNEVEFIPWSVKARTVLKSIVCGEMPLGYGTDRFDFGDSVAAQGGHIRCVVVDLRTSEETASAHRAIAVKEQEAYSIRVLEDKVEKLGLAINEAEKQSSKAAAEENEVIQLHEKAVKEVEKAEGLMKHFRNKFKDLLGPDDVPSPTLNANDRQKLSSTLSKYTANLEGAQSRLKVVEAAVYEKKGRTTKATALVRQANKAASGAANSLKKKKAQVADVKSSRSRARLSETMEAERASTRVSDVIAALHKTAEKRREQLNQKRSSAASSTYVQSLPGLPSALKKSLWHKMHRRRQQIVLRPNMDLLLNEMKEAAENSAFYSRDRTSSRNQTTAEDIVLRAEQLFLLSAYPEEDSTPSTPPSDSHASWAEPGWKVNLEVPKDEQHGSRSLLPRVPVSSVMQKNHSEMCSAPGRQVASLIKTTHLQALNTPLSAVAQAISLAETSPVAKESMMSDNDPFNISDVAMTAGYNFALRSPSKSSVSQSRRRVTPKEDTVAPPVAQAPSPKAVIKPKPTQPPALAPAPIPLKRSTSTSSRKSSTKTITKTDKPAKPKRSRSKSGGSASPRKTSKKKADSTAAAAADAASQARNFMQQQAALYGQQRAPSMEQHTAQYSPSYLKQVAPVPANLQGVPPPAMAAQQQQLLPQPPYGSPQQFQQRQLAQIRMMQQQQGRAGFPQQANMQFFNPAALQAAARQQSYGSQPQGPPPMPPPGAVATGRSSSAPIGAPPGQQRRTASGGDDNRNDPLFLLQEAAPAQKPSPPKPAPGS